jgi:hypothetical protein
VWEHSKTTGTTRFVFIALADHCDHDGLAWPSIDRVAWKCRVDRRTVQRAYNEIELLGEMVREIGGRGAHSTTLYRVTLPGCGQLDLKGGTSPPLRVAQSPIRAAESPNKGGTSPPEPSINRKEPRRAEIPSVENVTPAHELPERVNELRKQLRGGPIRRSIENHPSGNGDA